MKQMLSRLLCGAILLGLTACGNTSPASLTAANGSSSVDTLSKALNESSIVKSSSTPAAANEATSASSQQTALVPNAITPTAAGKTLVVYFSMPETTKPDNLSEDEESSIVVIDGEVLGNTQYVAYVIAENIGADIFRIEPKAPYPIDHDALTDLAKQEQNQNARPELLTNVENLSQYDTIFVGYPNWWGDMPMILYTFFDDNDFSGKTIIPFNTHGGSGFSDTIGTITGLEPNATVQQNGFTVSRNTVQDAEPDIVSWLGGLGY